MKKTLIALMALTGVTFGGSVDVSLKEQLDAVGYTAGDSFAITLTFNGSWGGLQTGTDLNLSTQASSGTQFIAIGSTDSKEWTDKTAWTITPGGITESTTPVVSLTLTSAEAKSGYWITPALACDGTSGAYSINNGSTNTGNTSFTISYDGSSKSAILTAVRTLVVGGDNATYTGTSYTYTTNVTITDWELDATEFTINDGGISKVSVTVPEPTTATLSLLALAGLAARRRRK